MKYRVTHRTAYHYPGPVARAYNEAHLAPRATPAQRILRHHLEIAPAPAYRRSRTDYFGNAAVHFAVQSPHRELVVTATTDVDLRPSTTPGPGGGTPWEEALRRARSASPDSLAAREFMLDSPLVTLSRALAAYAAPSFPEGRPIPAAVTDLMARIHAEFTYDPRATTVSTPLEQVFEERRGVCQDFAHLAIACVRATGLPARYVSGYLETAPPEGRAKLRGADASHAWFAVFDPAQGWLDFDPTNNVVPMERHITTAWGRDYADVSPLKGVIFGSGQGQTSEVAVDVERLD